MAEAIHEHDDDDFQSVDAGASTTYPQQCSALRKNGYVMLKGRPCKIMEMSTSKTGKHGHAKVNLVGIDIFTGKRNEDMCPSTHNMEVPNVKRVEYSVLNVEKDDYVTLMDDSSNTREDLKLPSGELGDEIRTKFENGDAIKVTVLQALGEEAIITCKLENEPKK